MVINKDTAHTVVSSSLRIFDISGKVLGNVTSFDTNTMEVTLSNGGSVTANDFLFYVDSSDDASVLEGLLEGSLLPKIVNRGSGLPKRALDPEDTSPEHLLVRKGGCEPMLVQCTNCSTYFVMISASGDLWSTTRSDASDKWLTATKLDKDSIVCDNCGEAVVYDEK